MPVTDANTTTKVSSTDKLAGGFELFGSLFMAYSIGQQGLNSLFSNPMALLSMGMSMSLLFSPTSVAALGKLLGPWAANPWAIAALLVAAVLIGMLSKSKKNVDHDLSPNEQNLKDLNNQTKVVWASGPVVAITAGMALAAVGINLSGNAPLYQTIAVPEMALTQAMHQATGTNSPLNTTTFVQKGDGTAGNPDRVVIVKSGPKDANGQPTEIVEAFSLRPGTEFRSASGPSQGYIPFFLPDGSVNPDAVSSLGTESKMLNVAVKGDLTAAGRAQAVQIAGGSNKYAAPVLH